MGYLPRFNNLQKRLGRLIADLDKHEIFTLSGTLAYTVALALSPIILLLVTLTGLFTDQYQNEIVQQSRSLLGQAGGEVIKVIIESTDKNKNYFTISGIVSFLLILISASAVFSQLRSALDKIDEFKKPPQQNSIFTFIKEKFFLSSLVLGFIFLLITSLSVNTFLETTLIKNEEFFWVIFSQTLAFILFFLLFTLMFRFIPSQRFPWRRCIISSFNATIFFMVGKYLISLYLGHSAVGSSYGAAGSFIVLLVWLYYTSATFFISYEFTSNVILNEQNKS